MTWFAGVCQALIMFTVAGDVIGRYVFNVLFGWSYAFIVLYLMVAAIGAEWADNTEKQGKTGKKVLLTFRDALFD